MRLTGVAYVISMRGRPISLAFCVPLLAVIGGIAIHARVQSPATGEPITVEERVRLLAKGKELFVTRCARCHNELGDKPLKTGPPLNERGLSTDQIARAVNGRLRGDTDENRRAVTLYISSLMKAKAPEEKTPPKS